MTIKNQFCPVVILLLLLLISCSKAKIQPNKTQDTTKNTDTTTTITLPAGVATTFSSNATQWLISMHSDGGSVDAESNSKNCIATDAAGNIYVLFNFYGALDLDPGTAIVPYSSYALSRATLAKYSSAGKLLWSKVFESDGSVNVIGMQIDQSGNVYCSLFNTSNDTYIKFDGTTHAMKQANGSNVILKFNTSGATQWLDEVACNAYETRGYNNLTGIAIDAQGNVYIGGSFLKNLFVYDSSTNVISATDLNNPNLQCVIIKCDNKGKYLSSKVLFHTGVGAPFAPTVNIAVDNSQNVYLSSFIDELTPITGTIQIGNIYYGAPVIAKYDKNWNWVWVRNDDSNALFHIKTDASGYIYTTDGSNIAGVSKLTADGALVWTKSISSAYGGESGPESISIGNDGSVIFAGDFNTYPYGYYQGPGRGIMIVKYDAGGNILYSKTLSGYNPMDISSEYGITFDNAGYLNMIGYFNDSFKYFKDSSDPVYKTPDFNPSFFIAHFPDKP